MFWQKNAQRAAIFHEQLRLPILRGFRAQLHADRRMRKVELSIAESPEGVMLDGPDEIEDCYASIITTSKTTAPFGESG